MEAITDTVLQFGYRVWQVKPPTPSIMVVVKATFDFRRNAPCVLAEEQAPCGGDVHHDDDEELSLRYENDFAILKPRGECFVAGSAFAAGGRRARELPASFRIGQVQKDFLVLGERYWDGGLRSKPSAPAPFTEMPLRRERAYGGPGHKTNPLGLGYKGHAPEGGRQLPNFERQDSLIKSTRSKPEPVVTTAMPMGDKNRIKLAGTYDKRYMQSRWPYFPADFNWEFFLSAPEDQRIMGYWRGDEEIALLNLHREHSTFKTSLPDIRPRVFLHKQPAESVRDFAEIPVALDTITVDTDREKVFCLWRGICEVESDDLDDVASVFIMHEDALARTPAVAVFERFLVVQLDEDEEEEAEPEPEPAPGLDAPPTEIAPSLVPDGESPEPEQDDFQMDPAVQAMFDNFEEPAEETPPSPKAAKERLLATGFDVPPEILAMLDAAEEDDEKPAPEPPPEPDVDERERFLRALRSGDALFGEVFENIDLSGMDLSGENLEGVIFVSVSFSETNFRGARLKEAQLSECELVKAFFRKADLEDADLSGCNAREASFVGANLEGLSADKGVFDGADMRGVRGKEATFTESSLKGAVFGAAVLDEADFAGANVENADFTETSLAGAIFEGARASGARFDRANLTGFRAAEGADFSKCSLIGVQAVESFWDDSNLQDADFSSSILNGAFFSGALMFRTRLDRCQIANGTLSKAKLAHASLRAANLFEADLESADMSFADFTAANLFGAEIWKAETNGALFTAANVKRTKIGVFRT